MMTFSSTPSPAILLLLFDSSQQCIPKSSSCQNANKQILMQQRIITQCTVRSSQYHLFKWRSSSDLISLHSAKPTRYLTQPWQGLASLHWTWPKQLREYCLSHSTEAAELNSFKGADLLLFQNYIMYCYYISALLTPCICLQFFKQNLMSNHALKLPHFTTEIIYTKLRHFLSLFRNLKSIFIHLYERQQCHENYTTGTYKQIAFTVTVIRQGVIGFQIFISLHFMTAFTSALEGVFQEF